MWFRCTYLESLAHRLEVYVVFIKCFMYKYRSHTKTKHALEITHDIAVKTREERRSHMSSQLRSQYHLGFVEISCQ